MKHVQLFEQFISEAKISSSDLKKIQKKFPKADVKLDKGSIKIHFAEGDAPSSWEKEFAWSFIWDGETAAAGVDGNYDMNYRLAGKAEVVNSVKDLFNALSDNADWD